MKLTGKAREAFSEYLASKYNKYIELNNNYYDDALNISKDFHCLPEILQNALIVEFMDECGVYIDIKSSFDYMGKYNRGYNSVISTEGSEERIHIFNKDGDCFNNRLESFDAAVEKANEILNKKLNGN